MVNRDDDVLPFKPIGSTALNIVRGLRAKTVDTLEREATDLENAARLKRFAAEQIRKGVVNE
jgi:hypothetical protein